MGFQNSAFLGEEETASIYYHDIFDYALDAKEIIKWRVGEKGLALFTKTKEILNKDGFYFLKNKENLLYKKTLRERISNRKLEIVKKNASVLNKIPTVLGIFVTGALAMNNAEEESDVDLMIITNRNSLWLTRLLVYLILKVINSSVRKPGEIYQKDKLCLNIWLDESALSWNLQDRNIYSAHEIAQIKSIVDKGDIYQRFLQKNIWILDYWPNSVKIENIKHKTKNYSKNKYSNKGCLFERFCFWIQYKYMEKRITREKISLHKAIFHPKNWGEAVLKKLSS